MKKEKTKCPWCIGDALMEAYHDTEWGVPVHDDTLLFEYLILDAFQAGLSWKTILHRREHFRKAFANFDYKKVAKFEKISLICKNLCKTDQNGSFSICTYNSIGYFYK